MTGCSSSSVVHLHFAIKRLKIICLVEDLMREKVAQLARARLAVDGLPISPHRL